MSYSYERIKKRKSGKKRTKKKRKFMNQQTGNKRDTAHDVTPSTRVPHSLALSDGALQKNNQLFISRRSHAFLEKPLRRITVIMSTSPRGKRFISQYLRRELRILGEISESFAVFFSLEDFKLKRILFFLFFAFGLAANTTLASYRKKILYSRVTLITVF